MDNKYFDDAREMFLTQGWKNFMEETAESIGMTRIEALEDAESFWKAKGALDVMHRILGYENFLKHSEDQAGEDDEEDS